MAVFIIVDLFFYNKCAYVSENDNEMFANAFFTKIPKKIIAGIKILAASEGYIMLYCILFFIDCLLIFAQSAFFYFYFKVSGECK